MKMCGIIGIITDKPFSVGMTLLPALRRLEYRGYDSCGYAVLGGFYQKAIGGIENLKTANEETTLGISHTRWATHGGVTVINAHPHFDTDKTIFVVHNGIIENYEALKEKLAQKGHHFVSQTDSEVIPHFLAEQLKDGKSPEAAMKEFINIARGTFAVLWYEKGKNILYAMKRDSPLVLGLIDGKHILASDIYAFSNETNKAIFFDDDEYSVIEPDRYTFYDCFGEVVKKEITTFEWTTKSESKEKYDHYMIKEIKEQPEVAERLIRSFETTQKHKLKEFTRLIKESNQVVFLACGTSYHASLVGAFLFTKLGIRAHSVIASEFEHFLLVDKKTLVIPISQSGETMDVVTVLKDIKLKKAKIASIVNVPYSTVQRLSDVSIEVLAGQEICVAATKSYTNQLITLFALAHELGDKEIALDKIPRQIQETIKENEAHIQKLADQLHKEDHIFVLGRGMSYPTAREIALKLKEIPYIHAEGMMAGELKHGTIALIEKGTPVVCLVPNANPDMISSTKEVEARGARTIIVSNTDGEIHLPRCGDAEFAIYAGLFGHLLSYYIAKLRKLPIDKPRNLAKSVTVK
jgi:glutamine---fructose-6-phosphate transaminase (isomerizing)